MNTAFTSFLYSSFLYLLPCAPPLLKFMTPFFFIILQIYEYSLVSSFNVAHIYMYLELGSGKFSARSPLKKTESSLSSSEGGTR